MIYKSYCNSPLGTLLLVSEGEKLLGLFIEGQKYYLNSITEELIEDNQLAIFKQTKNWLQRYFKEEQPSIHTIPLAPRGTEFRQIVWQLLCEIPYGTVITYKELASRVAEKLNKKSMSAQAIGQAVGHNPISIIIPCHRVVGTNKQLTGYAAGIEKKKKLLELENRNK